MSNYDWSRFTVRIDISATQQSLYEAWSNQEMMELWFLRLCAYSKGDGTPLGRFESVEKGDTYKWHWHGWPDEAVEHGEILEANGTDMLKFTFGKAGVCTVTIKEMEGENIVELVQENIPSDDYGMHQWHLGCKTGWTFYFANLKSLLEGGIDLRNKNEQLKGVINS